MTSAFLAAAAFPFAAVLEARWHDVLREYRAIAHDVVDWHERKLYDEGWKVFGLYDFPDGRAVTVNTARCPVTAGIIEGHVPRHGAVGFSVLRPMTRIRRHEGYQGRFLRCHLALDVPPGDCGLRVEDEVGHWQTGRVIVFDDRRPHEAWNLTDAERVVLLVDFVPDS